MFGLLEVEENLLLVPIAAVPIGMNLEGGLDNVLASY